MSRYQFQHGRTLDALELQGCRIVPASRIRAGHELCYLESRMNHFVESVETMNDGRIRVRSGNDTKTETFDADELVYVR